MITKVRVASVLVGCVLIPLTPVAHAATAQPLVTLTAGQASPGTKVATTLTAQGSSPRVVFRTSTGSTLTCVGLTASATLVAGPSTSGAVGTLAGPSFVLKTCVGPFGLVLNLTGSGTWSVTAAQAKSGASTPVTFGNVHLSGTFGSSTNCSFDLNGSMAAAFDNASSQLTLNGASTNLVFSNMRGGCYGAFTNGSGASFAATMSTVANTQAYNPITISAS